MTATELATANMADIDNRKILLLTFDDGYSNFYTEVFPVLKKNDEGYNVFDWLIHRPLRLFDC